MAIYMNRDLQGCYAAGKTPRDIADDALEQLETLKSVVKGEIMAAHDDLNAASADFLNFGENTLQEGKIDIEQEHETVLQQITEVKDLAMGAGYDVSSCTNIREQLLNLLPAEYTDQMSKCISQTSTEESRIMTDARYVVDVYYNRIGDLEFQVKQCKGEILCLSPILTQIQLDVVRLPQYIRTEVIAVEELLKPLQLSVESCSTTKVSEYVGDATAIFQDIQLCVNKILG